MKILRITQILGLASLMLLFVQCDDEIYLPDQATAAKSGKSKAPSGETAGNNLSYPVLWADDYEKVLPGTMGEYTLEGEWWYVWGEDPYDPQQPVYSCEPDPNNPELCIGGEAPGDGESIVYKAYVQKDVNNTWQAFNATPINPVDVDFIDWGDDLESVDFSINSMVRAEIVLYEALDGEEFVDPTLPPYLEAPMRHVYGWGSNEVHGMQAYKNGDPAFDMVEGDMATVYSHNARFTIQKLNKDLGDLGELTWDPELKEWTGDDVNEPIFNMAVYQAGDGPGYYNAEINVKGKVIYGYTWKVRTLNQGEGYYRLTFSFDTDGPKELRTFIDEDTEIIVAEEVEPEELLAAAEAGGGTGGIAVKDADNNITYMDILITPKTKGGGGSDNGTPGGGKGRH